MSEGRSPGEGVRREASIETRRDKFRSVITLTLLSIFGIEVVSSLALPFIVRGSSTPTSPEFLTLVKDSLTLVFGPTVALLDQLLVSTSGQGAMERRRRRPSRPSRLLRQRPVQLGQPKRLSPWPRGLMYNSQSVVRVLKDAPATYYMARTNETSGFDT
jgi:hypothetical protein